MAMVLVIILVLILLFFPFPPRIQASGYGLRQQNRADYSPRDRFRMRRSPSSGQFSQVTLDNILSNDSEIPSARREQRRSSSSSYDRYGGSEGMQPPARHSKAHKCTSFKNFKDSPRNWFFFRRSTKYFKWLSPSITET